jgi:hypothetical protein
MRNLFIVPLAGLLLIILFQTGAQAQFDVIYVKGKVFYKPKTAESDTPKEVRVGDKIDRMNLLDFTKDKAAYVVLYNLSYGRIVVPDREDEVPPISTGTSGNSIVKRDNPVIHAFRSIFEEMEQKNNIFLSDSGRWDVTDEFEEAISHHLPSVQMAIYEALDSTDIMFRFKYLTPDGEIKTQEKPILFHTKVGDQVRTELYFGKKYLFSDSLGNMIPENNILFRHTEYRIIVPKKKSNTEPPKQATANKPKSKKTTNRRRIDKSDYMYTDAFKVRYPDSLEALKKEVQTLLNGYLVSGKNLNESIQLVIPYIEKYHGKVVPEDVEAWIRRNFTIEIKK